MQPILPKKPVSQVGAAICIFCLTILIISVVNLPESNPNSLVAMKDYKISEFGDMMIEMLPEGLPFTIFMPSDHAFERDLKLRWNTSSLAHKRDDTYAVVSRILAFSAVPEAIWSRAIHANESIHFDSFSGFPLNVLKSSDGKLVVNKIKAELVDIQREEIVLHIMNGVIMDSMFRQSLV